VVAQVAGLPVSPEGYLPAPLWERVGLGGAAGGGAAPPAGSSNAAVRRASLVGGCAASEGA
jgi:hypothetical protein